MKPLLALIALAGLILALLAVRDRGEKSTAERGNVARPPALTGEGLPREPNQAPTVGGPGSATEQPRTRLEVSSDESAVPPRPAGDATANAARSTATLHVRVVDEVGAAIDEARVVLQPTAELTAPDSGDHTHVAGSTSRGGHVVLEVPAGRRLELRGEHRGQASESTVFVEALRAGAHAEVTITMQTRADVELTGRVVDAVTGAPLAGIQVHVEHATGYYVPPEERPRRTLPPRAVPDAVTDAAGQFRVPAKSWRTSFALCTGVGWSPRLALLRRPGVVGAEAEEPIEIALLGAAEIEGTVTGTTTPSVVTAELASQELMVDAQFAVRTFEPLPTTFELVAPVDGRGHFTLGEVPARAALSLSLSDAETRVVLLKEPEPVRLAPKEMRRVSWSLETGGRFECRVREATGAPAPGVELWLLPSDGAHAGETMAYWTPLQRAHTDAEGRATFDDVQVGRWIVALAPVRSRNAPDHARYAIEVTLPSFGAVVPVELTLHPGLYITGIVRTPDGTPRACYVSARNAGFTASVQASECKDGAFRIGPLLPGRYDLAAHDQSNAASGAAQLASASVQQVAAGAIDVELRLGEGCALVLAAVANGAPVPATFECRSVDRDGAHLTMGFKATADLSGLSPGTYRVLAHTEDGRVGLDTVELVAGERAEVTVEVAPGGRVRVEHLGSTGVLTASFADAQGPISVLWARPGEVTELIAPVGELSLHLLVREFDVATQTSTTLRDERRKVKLAAGSEVEVEVGP